VLDEEYIKEHSFEQFVPDRKTAVGNVIYNLEITIYIDIPVFFSIK